MERTLTIVVAAAAPVLASLSGSIGAASQPGEYVDVVVSFEESEISRSIAKFYEYLLDRNLLPLMELTIDSRYLATTLRMNGIFPVGYPGADADRLLCKLNQKICAMTFDESQQKHVPQPVLYDVGDVIDVPALRFEPYEFSIPYRGEVEEAGPTLAAIDREAKFRGASVGQRDEYRDRNAQAMTQPNGNLRVPARGYETACKIPREDVIDPESQLYAIEGISVTPSVRTKLRSQESACRRTEEFDACNSHNTSALEQISYWFPRSLCLKDEQARVAVIDSEVDRLHSDFFDQTGSAFDDSPPSNAPGPAPTCAPSDETSEKAHGTHVAGIIGSRHNGRGISGVHPHVRLRSYMNDYKNLAHHVVSADQNAVTIVNASWTTEGTGPRPLVDNLYAKRARDYNKILFVAAAGNEGQTLDTASCGALIPVCLHYLPNVLTVGALNSSGDALWAHSNRGDRVVHIAAPGVGIVSTCDGNRLCRASGTSQATAFVTGAAALLASLNPYLTPEAIKQRLMYTADLLPGLETGVASGRLNLRRALEYYEKDVVSLKDRAKPLIGSLRAVGTVFLFSRGAIQEEGHPIRAREIRRIVWDSDENDFSVLAYQKNELIRFSHVTFQPVDNPSYQVETDKLRLDADRTSQAIQLSDIRDLVIRTPNGS